MSDAVPNTSFQDAPLSWLHLSDFHFGKDSYGQINILGKILEEVQAVAINWRKPDFIFLTGDLSNRGKMNEFESLNKELIVPLLDILGPEYLDRIFITPGNHDVDRSAGRAVKRLGVLDEIQEFLDPTEEGVELRSPLFPRFKAFDSYKWTIENAHWVSSVDGVLARTISVGAMSVGVLCINTSWLCGADGEQHHLSPGISLLEQGLQKLTGCTPLFVIGHHPIDWMMPRDAKKMLTLLARSKAIYLHGHLHKTDAQTLHAGSDSATIIQAGCSFLVRDDEIWKSRIIWGGFYPEPRTILVRPKVWIADHFEWRIDSEAFSEQLRAPGADYWVLGDRQWNTTTSAGATAKLAPEKKEISLPEAWVYIDSKFIQEHEGSVGNDRLLQYFDGRVPSWEDVLSGRIPERTVVSELVTVIKEGLAANESQMTLLMGAGGDGKSTAFLQTVVKLAKLISSETRIIWRSSYEKGLPSDLLKVISKSPDNWLIVSDEADSLADDIYVGLRNCGGHKNIHFLVTCRDTDWIEGGGGSYSWNSVIRYVVRTLHGLELNDAASIVDAWSSLGEKGLGKLSGLDRNAAIQHLLDAAKQEATSKDGAFLGAMLRVRLGLALKDHVAELLARLGKREIAGSAGNTLLDAFAYIAVPHADNILFLSRAVLARALNIDESRIRKKVLGPLGDEAAADSLGKYILTRHRAIAEAAVSILEKQYFIDREDILTELVRSALLANEEQKLVLNFSGWRYLSGRMFDEGFESLGIKLATAACKADPANSYLAVKLAQLYRQVGQMENSVKIFRTQPYKADGNRAFFTEWATCEGHIGNCALGAWLSALSIADHTDARPPDIKDMCLGLACSAISFLSLFERYALGDYAVAGMAAVQLGLHIPRLPSDSRGIFDEQLERAHGCGIAPSSLSTSLKDFHVGLQLVHTRLEVELDFSLIPDDEVTFSHLKRALKIDAHQ